MKWDIYFDYTIRGGVFTAPNATNPVDAENLPLLLQYLVSSIPTLKLPKGSDIVGIRIELARDAEVTASHPAEPEAASPP